MSNKESIEGLFQNAENFINSLDYESAETCYSYILSMQPDNTEALDSLGEILIEMDERERAKKVLSKSVDIAPNEGAAKYFNLGQIHEGQQAINFISKGIQILKNQKSDIIAGKIKGDVNDISKEIASALCSLTEIYMTDNCMDEDAEKNCSLFLEEAVSLAPESPEVLQTFASYRISQCKNDDAIDLLTKSYNLWKDKGVGDLRLPSYELRLSTCKLFLELGKYQLASEILNSLLDEDDQISEVWYLLGYAYSFFDKEASMESLLKCKKVLQRENCKEPVIHQKVDDLLKHISGSEVNTESMESNEEMELENKNI
eukprot:TRINITY_DN15188_c0_g1_i1.p1 TRINITY_DN15188_c0_g1~~TRINITY_DN15188_c0_g1_i1.p1  ORF type:complete len:316 (+),score=56.84 TRINITY_DN15188_c0_g1_i1:32-979(+)